MIRAIPMALALFSIVAAGCGSAGATAPLTASADSVWMRDVTSGAAIQVPDGWVRVEMTPTAYAESFGHFRRAHPHAALVMQEFMDGWVDDMSRFAAIDPRVPPGLVLLDTLDAGTDTNVRGAAEGLREMMGSARDVHSSAMRREPIGAGTAYAFDLTNRQDNAALRVAVASHGHLVVILTFVCNADDLPVYRPTFDRVLASLRFES